ncbi:MAG: COQ9 family protein, partial [Rhodospirillales bacterium]|nr:COQ9 family protein [Rhodospirillales bacterium]
PVDIRLSAMSARLRFRPRAYSHIGSVPFLDLADRRMEEGAATLEESRVSRRVRAVIALRLAQNRPHKEAIRRAVAVLALPRNARLAARCTARTVDSIWHAAGDTSTDFSWYTKRAILSAIFTATMLFWLNDASEDDSATLAFLDRRLADLRRPARLRQRASSVLQRFRRAA